MANTRQQIVDALIARMAAITTANGYSATIKTVKDWADPRTIEEESLPAITVRDTSDQLPDDGIAHGRRDHQVTMFLVVAFVGSESIKQCRETLKDMLVAIGTDDSFGGLVYDCEPLNSELMPDDANKKIGFGQLVLNIRYRSELWNM